MERGLQEVHCKPMRAILSLGVFKPLAPVGVMLDTEYLHIIYDGLGLSYFAYQ
jgi:hypothetical protein